MKGYTFIIKSYDNLHMGKESDNYEQIDLLVQRDSSTGLPCMNGSGVKGGIREFCFYKWVEAPYLENKDFEAFKENAQRWLRVFGTEPHILEGNLAYLLEYTNQESIRNLLESWDKTFQKGIADFESGLLVSIPIRTGAGAPSVSVTSVKCLDEITERVRLFDLEMHPAWKSVMDTNAEWTGHFTGLSFTGAIRLEEEPIQLMPSDMNMGTGITGLLNGSGPLGVLSEADLKLLTDDDHLPFDARNYIVYGESENLWYEQHVPRGTRFFTTVFGPAGDADFEALLKVLGAAPFIHFGANRTVGQGKCRMEPLFDIKQA